MEKPKQSSKVFRSMMEFEKEFLPKLFEEKTKFEHADTRNLGINMARATIFEIRGKLAKIKDIGSK